MNMNIASILKSTMAVSAAVAKLQAAAHQDTAMLDAANAKALEDAAALTAAALLDASKNDQATVPDVTYTEHMRLDAANVIAEWSQTDELGEGEGYGDRLLALIVGTAANSDTDLTEDEVEYAGMIAELVGDYLEDKGIPDADIDALIADGSFDNDVGERVHEALLDKLPDGEDAMIDDAGRFIDGPDDDSMLDATYRKVIAIRGGKKVRLKKRIAGTVRLNAAQKSAVRKMQRKAFSGTAKIKRAKSMRLRRKMGL